MCWGVGEFESNPKAAARAQAGSQTQGAAVAFLFFVFINKVETFLIESLRQIMYNLILSCRVITDI